VRWLTVNLSYEAMFRLGTARTLIRYEDLIDSPERAVRAVLPALALPPDRPLDFLRDSCVELRQTHSVAGNPVRFHNGPLQLRLDDQWRTDLPRRDQRLVGVVTAPLSRRYGYVRGRRDD
jgi:hypothetical protein